MTSLAEKIAEKNRRDEGSEERPIDELGIPIPVPETPQYWAAKMIGLNYRAKINEPPIHRLHTREGVLYDGHEEVAETLDNFYKYTRVKHGVKKWELIEFWRQVRDHVPKLNRRFLDVEGGMYWDLQESELITKAEVMKRIEEEKK